MTREHSVEADILSAGLGEDLFEPLLGDTVALTVVLTVRMPEIILSTSTRMASVHGGIGLVHCHSEISEQLSFVLYWSTCATIRLRMKNSLKRSDLELLQCQNFQGVASGLGQIPNYVGLRLSCPEEVH